MSGTGWKIEDQVGCGEHYAYVVLEHVAGVQQATGRRKLWEIRGAGVLAKVLRLCDCGAESKQAVASRMRSTTHRRRQRCSLVCG